MEVIKVPHLLLVFFGLYLTVVSSAGTTYYSSPACRYGGRGSLTAICENITSVYFKITTYRFDHLDETVKCINCHLGILEAGTFDITGNKIEILDLNNAAITSIKAKAFQGLIYMRHLILSNNPITEIQPGAFYGVRKVHTLELENAVSNLEDYVFKELIVLENLNLKNNNLTTLTQNTFYGLQYLKILHLANNKIKEIGNAFVHLNDIQYIGLENNEISKLDGKEFLGLDKLLDLRLANNYIGNITMELSPENSLRVLDLSNNHLGNKAVKIGTFRRPQNLEYLNLANNWFRSIPPKFLEEFLHLEVLDLHGNQIHSFETGAITGLPLLRRVDLSHNFVSSINITGRLILNDLHIFNLSYNDVTSFDVVRLVAKAPLLRLIDLTGNPNVDFLRKKVKPLDAVGVRMILDPPKDGKATEEENTEAEEIGLFQNYLQEEIRSGSNYGIHVTMFVLTSLVIVLVGVLFYIQLEVMRKYASAE